MVLLLCVCGKWKSPPHQFDQLKALNPFLKKKYFSNYYVKSVLIISVSCYFLLSGLLHILTWFCSYSSCSSRFCVQRSARVKSGKSKCEKYISLFQDLSAQQMPERREGKRLMLDREMLNCCCIILFMCARAHSVLVFHGLDLTQH